MNRYFITGTDTDCGKTYITSQLIQHIPRSMAIKPIASGGDDAEHLLHSKHHFSPRQINPWYFSLPVSPHLAASKEGKQVVLSELVEYCMNFHSPDSDTLFIEGAGGLYVPLNDNETWVDFLKHTQMPVVLVVGMKLGCINHALLTQMAFKANMINCVGWIANCLQPDMQVLQENIKTLTHFLEFPLLAIAPYKANLEWLRFIF